MDCIVTIFTASKTAELIISQNSYLSKISFFFCGIISISTHALGWSVWSLAPIVLLLLTFLTAFLKFVYVHVGSNKWSNPFIGVKSDFHFLRKGRMQCVVSINSVRNTLSLFSTAAFKFGINFTLVVWHFKRLQVLTAEPLIGSNSLTEGLSLVKICKN